MTRIHVAQAEIIVGRVEDVLPTLPADHFDACLSDPPYHFASVVKRFGGKDAAPAQHGTDGAYARASKGFMGQTWDGGSVAFDPETWAAVLRCLKPGASVMAFGAPKNVHRLTCAIEDAGFEIRDMVLWLFASGFPKSYSVSKGLDKRAGVERKVVDPNKFSALNGKANVSVYGAASRPDETAAATPEAAAFEGFGSALKPSYEPCVWAMKLVDGTFAENALRHGVAGINIDAGRVGSSGGTAGSNRGTEPGVFGDKCTLNGAFGVPVPGLGRWPANILHDGSPEVLEAFAQAGERPSSGSAASPGLKGTGNGSTYAPIKAQGPIQNDTGSAARFFWSPSKTETIQECNCDICGLPSGTPDSKMSQHTEGEMPWHHARTVKLTSSPEFSEDGLPASVLSSAPGNLPQESAGRNPKDPRFVSSAAGFSTHSPAPGNDIAELSAPPWLRARIVQAAKSAGILCDSCVTAIAQSLVATRLGRDPASLPCLASIADPFRQTLIQCLALYAAHRESTDTILTTASLKQLLGSVFHAIANTTIKERNGQNSRSHQQRFFWSSKAQSDDRHFFCTICNDAYPADQRPRHRHGKPDTAHLIAHPTVKPRELCAYLAGMLLPPKRAEGSPRRLLVPFAGTGSEIIGAIDAGWDEVVGIEMDGCYAVIAKRRIEDRAPLLVARPAATERKQAPDLFARAVE